MTALSTLPRPRPQWRDEYFRDASALLEHCEQMRAWQRLSDDPFERADAALWSRLTPQQARQVFCHVIDLFGRLDASDALGNAYREECEARQIAGMSLMSETEFRERLARLCGQRAALEILPVTKA